MLLPWITTLSALREQVCALRKSGKQPPISGEGSLWVGSSPSAKSRLARFPRSTQNPKRSLCMGLAKRFVQRTRCSLELWTKTNNVSFIFTESQTNVLASSTQESLHVGSRVACALLWVEELLSKAEKSLLIAQRRASTQPTLKMLENIPQWLFLREILFVSFKIPITQ